MITLIISFQFINIIIIIKKTNQLNSIIYLISIDLI